MDGISALLEQFQQIAKEQVPGGAVCEGSLLQAGRGHLAAQVGRLRLEKADIRLNPYYNYTWEKDEGDPTYLRAGDRVLFLASGDGQTYYLVCKVVTCA